MHVVALIATVVALLLPATHSHAFSEKGQDCAKCHTLSNEDALAMLSDFGQNLKILEVRPGPASGMWEVDVDSAGKKGLVYIHYSKKYVLIGELYDLNAKKSVTRERLLEINKDADRCARRTVSSRYASASGCASNRSSTIGVAGTSR